MTTGEQKPTARRKRRLFPQTLGAAMAPTTRSLFKKRGFAEERILLEWKSIVGAELSVACVPQKLVHDRREGKAAKLHLDCASAFATELQHQEGVILERIATYFGYRAVDRLVLNHTMLPEISDHEIPVKAPAAPSIGTAGSDDPLQAALERFAEARKA